MTRWLTAWLACTLGAYGLFATPRTTPIHYDEVYWIGSTYYYHLAFERFDWNHPDWRLQSALENPPIAKYVLGLGLAVQGQHIVVRDMLGCFHVMFQQSRVMWGDSTSADYAKRKAVVGDMTVETCARPHGPGVSRPRDLPSMARYVALVCATLTSLVLFFFGASIANRATGLIASQLLLFHPDVIYAYNHAMADPVAMLLSVSAAFAAWTFYRRFTANVGPSRGEALRASVMVGALLGLACAAKMNSLVVVLFFGAAAFAAALASWRGARPRAFATLGYAALATGVALVVFVLVNPAILLDPVRGLTDVVREPQLNTAVQAQAMPQMHLTSLRHKLLVIATVMGGPLAFVLAVVAGLAAAWRSRRPGAWLVAGWFAIALACVAAWIPFPWSRYLLPVVPPVLLLLAHALVVAAEQVNARRRAASGAA